MLFKFLRRSPPMWTRIVRVTLLLGSTAGAAIGAELLRWKLGLCARRVVVERNGSTTRVRVSIPRSKSGRRKRRVLAPRS